MTKPVLGRNLREKKVVSSSGLELGRLLDLYFEDGGKIASLVVRPERETREVKDHLDRSGLLILPYESVRAMGRYVIVEFPFVQ